MKNLVLIVADQLRSDYLGCYGNREIGSSNIDRISEEGVLFENMYCSAPLCGPSRISLATSTYIGEHGHRNYGSTISPDVENLFSTIKRNGYHTGMFGKNHMFQYCRLGEVWDELDEICLGNYDNHPNYEHAFSSFELEKGHEYNITGRLTDEAIDFIDRSEGPFLLMVNYQDPHPAYTCPEPYYSMFNPEDMVLPVSYYAREGQPVRNEVWRVHSEMNQCSDSDMKRAIATYMGQIRYVDDSVGRIYEKLADMDLLNDTVLVFMSDHGELLGSLGMTHKLPVFYDCLTRIPVVMRFPNAEFSGTRFSSLTEEVDIAPTILEALDIPVPFSMVGKSMMKTLRKEEFWPKDSVLVEAGGGSPTCKTPIPGFKLRAPGIPTSFGPGAMVRKGVWKLSYYADDKAELYNIEEDPYEMNNLYDDPEYHEKSFEMMQLLLSRLLSVKMRPLIGNRRWPLDLECGRDLRFEPLEGHHK